jgi:hypothetical protein
MLRTMERVAGVLMAAGGEDPLDIEYETVANVCGEWLTKCNAELGKQERLERKGVSSSRAISINAINEIIRQMPAAMDEFTDDQMRGAIATVKSLIPSLQTLHGALVKETSKMLEQSLAGLTKELEDAADEERNAELQKDMQRLNNKIARGQEEVLADWRRRIK